MARDGSAPSAFRLGTSARLASIFRHVDVLVPGAFAALATGLLARDAGGYFPTAWGPAIAAFAAVGLTALVAWGRTDAGRLDAAFIGALLLLTGWTALSYLWSIDRAESVSALERAFVLLTGCAALLALATRRAALLLPVALLAAIAALCAYALETRLFPVRGSFNPDDPVSGYRLSVPVGYWNALGALAAVGTLLALGVATDTRLARSLRSFGAAAVTLLPVTLFFTFSRGAWLALAAGAAVSVAVSPGRLRLLAEGGVLALFPAVAVYAAWHASGLTSQQTTFAGAIHSGHVLAAVLVPMTVCSLLVPLAFVAIEPRLRIGRCARLSLGAAAALALVGTVVALGAWGSGISAVKRGYDTFVAPVPPAEGPNLTSRLFDANGNGRVQMWSVALGGDRGRWLTGAGAGSFVRTWEESPRANEIVHDAHGLYIQTLSELGVVGLVLLAAALAVPLAAGIRARAAPGIPAVVGAYAAFLVHNGVDWDWELTGVALTGLLVGCSLLVVARQGEPRALPVPVRAGVGAAAALVGTAALAATAGNGALAAAQSANQGRRYAAAASDAADARRFMPWSSEPLKALGTAQLEQGERAAAEASYRQAIAVDRADWQAWLDLAASLRAGPAREQAVAQARRLYPRSPEVAEFVAETATRTAR